MNNLRLLLKNSGKSQNDLAVALRVSHGTISNWVTGRHEIKDDMAIAIAEYFCVTPAYVKGFIEKNESVDKQAAADRPTKTINTLDLVQGLQSLSQMYAEGRLSEEEFSKLKKRIIDN